jgi:membrane fusion protein (multidrug efflux system)
MVVTVTDTDDYREYPARVRGAREVEVWARVQGILEARLYEEGSIVEAGDALFRIERAPFEVALRNAEAGLATAEATLRQTEREWRRVSGLFAQNAVSERERDNAQSAHELAEAQVKVARARVDQAELDLGYTDVTAPITGATSLEGVPEGTLVGPGTKLATVVQLDPAHVHFAMPENDAYTHRSARQREGGETAGEAYTVGILLPDGTAFPTEGLVDFTASIVDSATGSVQARAVVVNPDGLLLPGQFVRVRVLLQTFRGVPIVPEAAVGQGPSGPQVFIADEATATAMARPVRLGPVLPEGQVVLEGLAPDERVVTDGQARLHDGSDIVLTEPAGEVR